MQLIQQSKNINTLTRYIKKKKKKKPIKNQNFFNDTFFFH
jgi:hypothetical protein